MWQSKRARLVQHSIGFSDPFSYCLRIRILLSVPRVSYSMLQNLLSVMLLAFTKFLRDMLTWVFSCAALAYLWQSCALKNPHDPFCYLEISLVQALMNTVIDATKMYRANFASSMQASQFTLPATLRLLPLFMISLLKNVS